MDIKAGECYLINKDGNYVLTITKIDNTHCYHTEYSPKTGLRSGIVDSKFMQYHLIGYIKLGKLGKILYGS